MTEIKKSKIINDLKWLISSPCLIENNFSTSDFSVLTDKWMQEQYFLHSDWLNTLSNIDEEVFQKHFDKRTRLLGKYFEQLFSFWMDQSPYYSIILKNEQIKGPKKNLGEVDFIVKPKYQDEYYHIETAVKFYLGYNQSANWINWIGPNSKDRLDKKLEKLTKHQLLILNTSEGEKLLAEHSIKKEKIKTFLFLKGYFFYHINNIKNPITPIKKNPLHNSGWWCKSNELRQLQNPEIYWKPLKKLDWFSPFKEEGTESLLNNEALLDHLDSSHNKMAKSQLLLRLQKTKKGLQELDRGFVVPKEWPKLSHT